MMQRVALAFWKQKNMFKDKGKHRKKETKPLQCHLAYEEINWEK